MGIHADLLKRYNMESFEAYKKVFGNSKLTEKQFYETFLIQTNFVVNRMVEGLITTSECKDELAAREIARQEIAKLNGETYEPKENAKTLDERTAILEVDGLQAVIDQECRIAMLEMGITE